MESSTIVVLGGPSAGKTVFLSVLYHHLWQGSRKLTMRAGTGTMHSELLAAAESIENGTLPPATQALRHFDFELEHGRRLYQLRFLDYPGELFRKVFYETSVDSDEARELYDTCLSADGVIALVDPRSILDGTWDIDYAMTTLFRFFNSNARKQPKFVLAFTKRDETRELVSDSIAGFVKEHLPHLSQTLGDGMRLMHFCSITKSGNRIDLAKAKTVAAPLLAVIEALEAEEHGRDRDRFIRRIRWKRAAGRCAIVLLTASLLVVVFVLGVTCRHTAGNRSPPDDVQATQS